MGFEWYCSSFDLGKRKTYFSHLIVITKCSSWVFIIRLGQQLGLPLIYEREV